MNSLRTRLLLLFLVGFLPLAALTIRAPLNKRDAQLAAARAGVSQRAEQAVTSQHELMTDSRRFLKAISQLPQIATGDTVVCGRTLKVFKRIIDEGWSMSRVQMDGTVDCVSNPDEADASDSVVMQFASQLATNDSGIIGPYRFSNGTRDPKELVATIYIQLRDSLGATRGALTMRRRLNWLADLARASAGDSLSSISVHDSTGFVLARFPDAEHLVATTPLTHGSAVTPGMGDTQHGAGEGIGFDSVSRLFALRELPTMGSRRVYLSVGTAAGPIIRAANVALWQSIGWLLAWVALTVAAAWWAADRVVLRDVRALLSATERLGQGDLGARTGLTLHTGELGQLAHAFDTMAQQLEERQERLAQAQKMESVGQLAGGVAHDFNNLLTAIIGNTEAARGALEAGHPAREDLTHVLDAARRSGQLTRQLLSFARRHTLEAKVLSLTVLLDEVTSLLQRIIGEHITLTVTSDPLLHPTVIDPTQFEQLIMNLAVNARDAMPRGGSLTIDVRNVSVVEGDRDALHGVIPGTWVALSVTDTGTGMSPDVMRRVFEPFYTTKGVGEGTGLGLSVVYGTVQQHAGHVWVDSQAGEGTTVRILLPPSAETVVEHAQITPALARPARGHESILLVEDEPAVRAVSARLLRGSGYLVHEATDGMDAIVQMQGGLLNDVSLVITDVVMPRMGGPELVTVLRMRRPLLPVLLVSGYSEEGIPEALLRSPATAFVEKPFAGDVLLHATRRLLDER